MSSRSTVMRRVALRNVASHKLRLGLTLLAVILGTAFISGAMSFTAALSATFTAAVTSGYEGVDAVVSNSPTGVHRRDRAAIEELDSVSATNIGAETTIVIADAQGTALSTGDKPAAVKMWYPEDESVAVPRVIDQGRAPVGAVEAVLGVKAAARLGVSLGQNIIVVDPQGKRDYEVVGLYESSLDSKSIEGPTVLVDEPTYLATYTDGGNFRQLLVGASEGYSAEELVAELKDAYPDFTVRTGEELTEEITERISSALNFINYFLIAFGLVGLLVGTFMIANTFSMIVAQRTKEFALLRALGASRRQITASVRREALIVGLIGSALGVVAGWGLVAAIRVVMEALDMGLPQTGTTFTVGAVVWPVLIGTVVTVMSAWVPARRAGAVEPVEAMRSAETTTAQSLYWRTIVGVLLIGGGIAAALWGVQATGSGIGFRARLVGAATVALIGGFFLAGPALSIPIVPRFGRLIGLPFGYAGKLAALNSRRNPKRTSATAFALMLGVALVTAVGMFGATMKASVSDLAKEYVTADYMLSGPGIGQFPVPQEAIVDVQKLPGVEATIEQRYGVMLLEGSPEPVQILDNEAELIFRIDGRRGTTDLRNRSGFIADEDYAEAQGWEIGEEVWVGMPSAPRSGTMELIGTYEPNPMMGKVVVSRRAADAVNASVRSTVIGIGVRGDGTVPLDTLRRSLEDAVRDYIVVQVRSAAETATETSRGIDRMINVLYGLLALAVVIAVLGIINTLTLNVIERHREIGMLRAVGTQRAGVRRLITLEAVQVAVFGALAGMLIGVFLGWCFLTTLADQGLGVLVVPWPQMLAMLLAAGGVGVLAAILPARRAARIPPLAAIAQ